MKIPRLARLLTVLTAILACLAFATVAQAGTCDIELVGAQAQDDTTCQPPSGAGNWTFEVTVSGNVNALGLKIKNNPGAADVCWGQFQRRPVSSTVIATGIPAASTDVCPDIGKSFPDTNGPPLDVFAYIQGGNNSDVKIHVVWPDPAP